MIDLPDSTVCSFKISQNSQYRTMFFFTVHLPLHMGIIYNPQHISRLGTIFFSIKINGFFKTIEGKAIFSKKIYKLREFFRSTILF